MNPRVRQSKQARIRWAAVNALAVSALFVCASFSAQGQVTARSPSPSSKSESALRAPDKAYGTKTAPITMEVYTDYQCPMCRVFYDQTLREVIGTYVASGKVYLVHHDFPLQMHKYSGQAARWANACAEVGQFEAAEEALYDHQELWGADGNIAKYIAAAMPASDFKRVQSIMNGSGMPAPQASYPSTDPMAGVSRPCQVDTFIAQDIKLAYGISAPGTPYFVISYKGHAFAPIYSGVSWTVLKQLFDSLLKQ
jgi:hypothetical protein